VNLEIMDDGKAQAGNIEALQPRGRLRRSVCRRDRLFRQRFFNDVPRLLTSGVRVSVSDGVVNGRVFLDDGVTATRSTSGSIRAIGASDPVLTEPPTDQS